MSCGSIPTNYTKFCSGIPSNYIMFVIVYSLTLEALKGGRGQIDPSPLDFLGFKFLLLDRLSKALAQLFLVCEHIF